VFISLENVVFRKPDSNPDDFLPSICYWIFMQTPFFSTCDLCDAHKNDDSEDFRVLPALFRNFGGCGRFFGPVTTVKCFEDNSAIKASLDGTGFAESGNAGKVLVVDGGGSLRRALLGGNLGAAAQKNGWAGVVIDGCVRDVTELAALDIGIRALTSMPLATEKRNQGLTNLAIQVGGVWIRPNDWLYCDEDGIVVSASRLI
jgi:regulator of ribonuclease activity A